MSCYPRTGLVRLANLCERPSQYSKTHRKVCGNAITRKKEYGKARPIMRDRYFYQLDVLLGKADCRTSSILFSVFEITSRYVSQLNRCLYVGLFYRHTSDISYIPMADSAKASAHDVGSAFTMMPSQQAPSTIARSSMNRVSQVARHPQRSMRSESQDQAARTAVNIQCVHQHTSRDFQLLT